MTIEEIKKNLAERGMTQQELAINLGINPKALNEILRGARPMTESLRKHIRLLLVEPREAMLVYRVNLTDAKVTELCGDKCSPNPADREEAISAVVHHNLQELIEIGKKMEWSEDEKKFFGIE